MFKFLVFLSFLSFCATLPLPIFHSDLLVANVIDAEKDAVFGVSSLYGAIHEGKVFYEPRHSFNGGANFKLPATSSGNTVFLPFEQSYLKDPHCVVDFEGIVGFHTINPQTDGLYISLYDVSGNARSWTFYGYKYLTAMCWGALTPTVKATDQAPTEVYYK